MEKEQEQPRYRVVPVHTPSLTQALDVAVTRCMVWREAESGTPYSAMELLEFAQRQDKEHPLDGHKYYMVTTDGAIGISPGLEWLTTWMFVPMEDCQERDFILRKMKEEVQSKPEVKEATTPPPTPVAPEPPKKEPVKAEPPKEDSSAAMPKRALNFCPYCGVKVLPTNNFCTHCGKSLIFN